MCANPWIPVHTGRCCFPPFSLYYSMKGSIKHYYTRYSTQWSNKSHFSSIVLSLLIWEPCLRSTGEWMENCLCILEINKTKNLPSYVVKNNERSKEVNIIGDVMLENIQKFSFIKLVNIFFFWTFTHFFQFYLNSLVDCCRWIEVARLPDVFFILQN